MERRTRKEIEEYKAWKKELAAMGYTPEGCLNGGCKMRLTEENEVGAMVDYEDFCEIISLTDEEKRELLAMWKERTEQQ